MKTFLSYFLNGLLLVLPVAATFLILSYAIVTIDGLIPLPIPGLGLVLVILLVTAIGYLGRNLFLQPFVKIFERALEKAPFVNVIYQSAREFTEAFLGTEKKFDHPVLWEIGNSGILRVGFLTQDSMTSLDLVDHVGVYVPHSYNFSGNFFIVEKSKVRPLSISSSLAMRFAVTGGVVNIHAPENGTSPTTQVIPPPGV